MAYPCPVQFMQDVDGIIYKVLGVKEIEYDPWYDGIDRMPYTTKELILEPTNITLGYKWYI